MLNLLGLQNEKMTNLVTGRIIRNKNDANNVARFQTNVPDAIAKIAYCMKHPNMVAP